MKSLFTSLGFLYLIRSEYGLFISAESEKSPGTIMLLHDIPAFAALDISLSFVFDRNRVSIIPRVDCSSK
uniref:Uncharacterized protein n=1 Tax=Parascaris equorum TaxID=6256 RepID=A0A914RFT9_PAREQ